MDVCILFDFKIHYCARFCTSVHCTAEYGKAWIHTAAVSRHDKDKYGPFPQLLPFKPDPFTAHFMSSSLLALVSALQIPTALTPKTQEKMSSIFSGRIATVTSLTAWTILKNISAVMTENCFLLLMGACIHLKVAPRGCILKMASL